MGFDALKCVLSILEHGEHATSSQLGIYSQTLVFALRSLIRVDMSQGEMTSDKDIDEGRTGQANIRGGSLTMLVQFPTPLFVLFIG